MQALRAGLLVLLVGPAWADDWVRLDLGEHRLPGACPALAMKALPPAAPQKQQVQGMRQQQVSTWESGTVSVSMRAWPSVKLNDRQRIRAFHECARQGAQRVPSSLLVGPERASEEALLAALNQCLAERQQNFSARTVVLSRSSPRCAN
jgi:hypothetical protein